MKLGLFSLPSGEMDFRQAVDFARANGLCAIEPYPAHEFAVPDENALLSAASLAAYAKENGIAIPCFSMGIDIVSDERRKDSIERLKRYADVAAAMGAPFLHHTVFPHLSHNPAGARVFHEQLKVAAAGIREVFDYAATLGVRAIYEDQGFVFNGVERFDSLLTAVDRDIGVVADLGNILYVGEDAASFVGRLAPQIVHVHVKDYLFKSGKTVWPGEGWNPTLAGDYLRGTIVGHGVIDFVTVLRILLSAGYDGCFCLEYEGMEEPFSAIPHCIRNFTRFYEEARRLSGR